MLASDQHPLYIHVEHVRTLCSFQEWRSRLTGRVFEVPHADGLASPQPGDRAFLRYSGGRVLLTRDPAANEDGRAERQAPQRRATATQGSRPRRLPRTPVALNGLEIYGVKTYGTRARSRARGAKAARGRAQGAWWRPSGWFSILLLLTVLLVAVRLNLGSG